MAKKPPIPYKPIAGLNEWHAGQVQKRMDVLKSRREAYLKWVKESGSKNCFMCKRPMDKGLKGRMLPGGQGAVCGHCATSMVAQYQLPP